MPQAFSISDQIDEVLSLLNAVWTLAGGDEGDDGLLAVLLVVDEKLGAIRRGFKGATLKAALSAD
jgi:hypothetical protein